MHYTLTCQIYKNTAQQAAYEAAFSGSEWSIPMFLVGRRRVMWKAKSTPMPGHSYREREAASLEHWLGEGVPGLVLTATE